MDKCLRPQVFDTDVNAADSSEKWRHWKRTFQSYVRLIENVTDQDELDILVNLLDTSVYLYVSECGTFDEAVARLDSSYVKPVNEVFARNRLNTCQQTHGES